METVRDTSGNVYDLQKLALKCLNDGLDMIRMGRHRAISDGGQANVINGRIVWATDPSAVVYSSIGLAVYVTHRLGITDSRAYNAIIGYLMRALERVRRKIQGTKDNVTLFIDALNMMDAKWAKEEIVTVWETAISIAEGEVCPSPATPDTPDKPLEVRLVEAVMNKMGWHLSTSMYQVLNTKRKQIEDAIKEEMDWVENVKEQEKKRNPGPMLRFEDGKFLLNKEAAHLELAARIERLVNDLDEQSIKDVSQRERFIQQTSEEFFAFLGELVVDLKWVENKAKVKEQEKNKEPTDYDPAASIAKCVLPDFVRLCLRYREHAETLQSLLRMGEQRNAEFFFVWNGACIQEKELHTELANLKLTADAAHLSPEYVDDEETKVGTRCN